MESVLIKSQEITDMIYQRSKLRNVCHWRPIGTDKRAQSNGNGQLEFRTNRITPQLSKEREEVC